MTIPDSKRPEYRLLVFPSIELRHSKIWRWLAIVAYLSSAIAVFITSLPVTIKLLFLLLPIYFLWQFAQQWSAQAIARVHGMESGFYLVFDGDQYCRIIKWEYCSAWLLIIKIQYRNGIEKSFPILADSCSKNEFRRLRVAIRAFC